MHVLSQIDIEMYIFHEQTYIIMLGWVLKQFHVMQWDGYWDIVMCVCACTCVSCCSVFCYVMYVWHMLYAYGIWYPSATCTMFDSAILFTNILYQIIRHHTIMQHMSCLYQFIYPRSDWTRGVGSPILQLQNGVPKVPFLQVGRTQRSPRKVFVTKWQSKLTPSYKMSHRFCSTRIRSHPLARFALYRMVGTGGGYTRTILGSLGSNLQQPGQPESRFIFSVLLRSSVCFGVTLSEWPS